MSVQVLERLKAKLGAVVLETGTSHGDDWALVAPGAWHDVVAFLRDDPQCDFSYFVDLTAVDYPKRDARFELVLHLCSLGKGHRVRLKTRLFEEIAGEGHTAARPTRVATICDLYLAANWIEREVWDMFGVHFEGHPDERRLLLYEEFEGHPLRKDYDARKTQPLVPYRRGEDVLDKLAPFLNDEGMPFGRNESTPGKSSWGEDDTVKTDRN